ncbi:TonB-dependent receptor [Reichenbachiella carrageenanivorans]|uniref:TonB-dependent receptor n=1 Tax=Reichenbachiella carrageenanivorans TaxID=2979869 RepID=A0ABY6D257_9BACT|nr:TonB-dependent receptor [Reichenbachiella carrageenanivorans]UXX77930.1 TonB-dependent receptor [Reichenbachiella carrageenanivorans]
MKFNTIGFLLAFFFSPFFLFGQESIRLDRSYQGLSLASALDSIQKQNKVRIFYQPKWVEGQKVTQNTQGVMLVDFLNQSVQASGLKAVTYHGTIVFVANNPELYQIENSADDDLVVIGDQNAKLNEIVSVKGYISDGTNDEPLIGARVYITSLNIGTVTDFNGNYDLRVPVGKYTIEYSSISYENKPIDVIIKSAGKLDVALFSGSLQLDELVITADGQDANVQQRVSGLENMDIKTIKQLPTFMGEVDPVKSLTTMPGISTTGELSSGFNVRGGETGQNLILQDGAVIYNPTHLFGFYSAFNSDMVNEVNLYKGGGPANFGGRISSVLDIKLRHGDDEEYKVSGGVGLVSSRLTAEGPILKNKASFIVGGRTSYTNWLLHSLKNIELNSSSAAFYDTNVKLLYRIGDKDYLTGSFYLSHDDFNLAGDAQYDWGTTNFSLEWSHVFGAKWMSSLVLATSNYEVKSENTENELEAFSFRNGIRNVVGKYEILYKMHPKNTISAGIEYNHHQIEPGVLKPFVGNTSIDPVDVSDQQAHEVAIYIQDDWDLGARLALSAGLRASGFWRVGEGEIYDFESGEQVNRVPSSIDSVFYGKGDLISSFSGLEPRLSMRYLLTTSASLKMSYYRTFQYLHMISNTVSATPQDYYITSGPNLDPQYADQYSLGLFKNYRNNLYQISGEVFYKKMYNTVDFIEGAELLANEELDGSLVQGDGKAYGVEVQLKKNSGKLSGWVSYTYSRSLKRFEGDYDYETINNGDYYGSNNDKPHDLSMVLSYKLGARWVLSANFSYSTGRPITVPVSNFRFDKTPSVLTYSERNAYRIPDYHRLDLSLTLLPTLKKSSLLSGEWIFSIYNVYGRKNAYSIYFTQWGGAKKMSILGSVFPSVTYNFSISK